MTESGGAPHSSQDRVFISYEAEGGRDLAEAVHAALNREGVVGWVWHLHRHSGAPTFAEIAEHIAEADCVLFIRKVGTRESGGQRYEINHALALAKRLWVITMDRGHVPAALAGFNHDVTSAQDIDETVRRWLTQWRQGFPRWPTITDEDTGIGGE